MMSASYEVCLLTSPVRAVLPTLRRMVSPLYRFHHSAIDCVEIHYSSERDALLVRLCFSENFSERNRQVELAQDLEEKGFEVLESSELTDVERSRFEQLLQEQYDNRIQQYPSSASPSVVSKLIDSLEAHLASQVSAPAHPSVQMRPRLSTVDAQAHVIDEIAMFGVDVEGSRGGVAAMPAPHARTAEAVLNAGPRQPPRASTEVDGLLDALWPS